MRSRLIRAALATAALGLAAPTASHATLVYSKPGAKGSVWVAQDDGSGARKLSAYAGLPAISADGASVAYVADLYSEHPAVALRPAAGGAARTLVDHWGFLPLEWSSDNQHLLVITQKNYKSAQRLKVIDTVGGEARTLAKGYFSGMDFSPGGDFVVYGRSGKQESFPDTDLYVVPVGGGTPVNLTEDGHSSNPVWGPDAIAYSRYRRPTGKHRKEDGPKYNLFLIDPASSVKRQLTHDKVPFLLTGLTPQAWSADGAALLANFGGQDTFYGVRIDPQTGEERTLRKAGKVPVVATDISADGSTVLGYTGFIDSADGDVVTEPFAGGKPTVLVKHAIDPDWNR